MTFTTKYSLGGSFWILRDNQVYECKIAVIRATVESYTEGDQTFGKESIRYSDYAQKNFVSEYNLFPTKQALLASL